MAEKELDGKVAVVTGAARNIGRALAVLADVTDEAAVARMASAGVERFGRIDILVNNAAVRRVFELTTNTQASS
jgi:NAD(P)-dependent dehydrogenase (short-subunit alcohol dehydrogenase family)